MIISRDLCVGHGVNVLMILQEKFEDTTGVITSRKSKIPQG